MTVALSSDGDTIYFALLGDVFSVPSSGGDAIRLTSGWPYDHKPTTDPSGEKVAYISDRNGGTGDLWVMNIDGLTNTAFTSNGAERPSWSSDGRRIYFDSSRMTSYGFFKRSIRYVDLDTGTAETCQVPLDDEYRSAFGAVPIQPEDQILFFAQHVFGRIDLMVVADCTGPHIAIVAHNVAPIPVVYIETSRKIFLVRHLDSGDQVLELEVIESLQNGNFVVQDNGPLFAVPPNADVASIAASRDGRYLVGAVNGTLLHIDLLSKKSKKVEFQAHFPAPSMRGTKIRNTLPSKMDSTRIIRWPQTVSSTGDLVFEALGSIWVKQSSGDVEPVEIAGAKSKLQRHSPAVSPDGTEVAYVTVDNQNLGYVMITSLLDGETRTLSSEKGFYVSPEWSHDGSKVIFMRATQSPFSRAGQFDPGRSSPTNITLEWASTSSDKSGVLASGILPLDSHLLYYSPIVASHDGQWVTFSRRLAAKHSKQLVAVKMDGSAERILYEYGSGVDLLMLSPDGSEVIAVETAGQSAHIGNADLLRQHMAEDRVFSLDMSGLKEVPIPWLNFVKWQGGRCPLMMSSSENVYQKCGSNPRNTQRIDSIDLRFEKSMPKGKIAFSGANVVSFEQNGIEEDADLLVIDNRIVQRLSKSSQTDAQSTLQIDIGGRWIMPGIVDTHVHIHGTGRHVFPTQRREYVESLAFGVTTVLEPSGTASDIMSQAELVESGRWIGPRVFSTLTPILGTFWYDDGFIKIEQEADADRLAQWLQNTGSLMLKSYLQERRDVRRWLINSASAHSLLSTAEGRCSSYDRDLSYCFGHDLMLAADGTSSIEHYYFPKHRLYTDATQYLGKTGVRITPTFSLFLSGEYVFSKSDRDQLKMGRFGGRELRSAVVQLDDNRIARLELAVESLMEVVRFGGSVDLGSHSEPGAVSAHYEIWFLVQGGFEPIDAIRAATLSGAEKLGLQQELGSIEEGKLADFLVLRCNPLQNIRCTADIEYVVKNGFVWHADSMTQMWPEYKPLPKPWWHSDEDWEKLKPELPNPWEGVPIVDGVELEQPTIH